MDNELKDITYNLDWSSEKRFIVSAAQKKDGGRNWELVVKRAPEPKSCDLYDICYLLQMDSGKAYSVEKAQREDDGSWHLEIRKQEAADDND